MRKQVIVAGVLALILGLLLLFIVTRPGFQNLPKPLLVTLSAGKSNGPFTVFAGFDGPMFLLPDGSLWHWGTDVTNLQRLPELLDDQHQWAKAFNGRPNNKWMALDRSGRIWEAARGGVPSPASLPVKNHNWIDVSGGWRYDLGLQKDGTILGWDSGSVTEVHTNIHWRAVSAYGPSCLGVSTDGRLWSWQRNGFSPLAFSSPKLETTNANWVGLAEGEYAWSSSGELWGTPVARLNSSNPVPGRFALGSIVHEIHSDGTLWAIGAPMPSTVRTMFASGTALLGPLSQSVAYGYSFRPVFNGLMSVSRNLTWHQIGKRSDWLSVWSCDETYFGLTFDGTVWTWGTDWGRKPAITLTERVTQLWQAIRDQLQPRASRGNRFIPVTQPYQKEPRPLMRFTSATP